MLEHWNTGWTTGMLECCKLPNWTLQTCQTSLLDPLDPLRHQQLTPQNLPVSCSPALKPSEPPCLHPSDPVSPHQRRTLEILSVTSCKPLRSCQSPREDPSDPVSHQQWTLQLYQSPLLDPSDPVSHFCRILECWSFETLEFGNAGALEHWTTGMLECCKADKLDS